MPETGDDASLATRVALLEAKVRLIALALKAAIAVAVSAFVAWWVDKS